MKKNKAVRIESNNRSSGDARKRTVSRRMVVKSLVLAPVQWSLLSSLIKSQGISGMFPGVQENAGDLYLPNQPIGKAQGIVPGRVSWVWNPAATNPGCANLPVAGDVTEDKYDAWFMDKNTNQDIVDKMLAAGLCSIADKKKIKDAWDTLFRFHNNKRGKGNAYYSKGEKIYLKLNRTTASGGISPDYVRRKDRPVSLAFETSPQIVTAMLRQLVNVVGVPQESITVGDAMRNLYQDEYLKYSAEFPKVNYLSSFGNSSGRIKSVEGSSDKIFYSDKKTVMTTAGSDKIYTVLEDAEYLINLPAMKGHNVAGITLCAKNHFGSQTRNAASHLHAGLNNSSRRGYGYYRVLVDLMGNKYTGEKNLFYIHDGLWSGSNWNGLPVKFRMQPFNNHWSSSMLLSLDPVAIDSVAFDILRTEFSDPDHNVAYISEPGVDDYLHQAADKKNWPAGITYAPNGDDVPIPDTLGVHEHWNNPVDKEYSRNLGKKEGIELVRIFQKG